MTPSTATKRIQALEDAIGVQLLERTSRGMQLTPAGEVTARHARAAIGSLEGLHAQLNAVAGTVGGALVITANVSSWVAYLAEDVADYARAHRGVSIDLRDASTADVVRLVLAGDCDVGVCPASGPLPPQLDAQPYCSDHLVAVMAHGHSAARLSSMNLQQLLEHDLIGWSPRGSLMRTVQQAAENIGRPLRLRWRMNSVDSARALVRAGMGIAVLPDSMVRPFEEEAALTLVPISEPWAERQLQIITLKQRARSQAAEALLRQLSHRRH